MASFQLREDIDSCTGITELQDIHVKVTQLLEVYSKKFQEALTASDNSLLCNYGLCLKYYYKVWYMCECSSIYMIESVFMVIGIGRVRY